MVISLFEFKMNVIIEISFVLQLDNTCYRPNVDSASETMHAQYIQIEWEKDNI